MFLAACGGDSLAQPIDATPLDAAATTDASCTARPPTVVFLNRAGGTYTYGAPQDSSTNTMTIGSPGTLTLPAPTVNEDDWTAFVTCFTSKYAPFNVTVTEIDPGAAAHVELVVIDRADQIGFPDTATGVAGGLNCQGQVPKIEERGIVMVMWSPLAITGARCQKAAQMVGFTLGLDRAFSCADIMTWENQCGPPGDRTFVDADVPCGEVMTRTCRCGHATQNTYRQLDTTLRQICP